MLDQILPGSLFSVNVFGCRRSSLFVQWCVFGWVSSVFPGVMYCCGQRFVRAWRKEGRKKQRKEWREGGREGGGEGGRKKGRKEGRERGAMWRGVEWRDAVCFLLNRVP